MPDSLPPVAKTSSDSELRPSEGSEPGTVDLSLNEAPQWFRTLRLSIEADGLLFTGICAETAAEEYASGQRHALDVVERFLILRDGQPAPIPSR